MLLAVFFTFTSNLFLFLIHGLPWGTLLAGYLFLKHEGDSVWSENMRNMQATRVHVLNWITVLLIPVTSSVPVIIM